MAGIGVHDDRNRCSPSLGIGVHLQPEWVFMMDRITQSALAGAALFCQSFALLGYFGVVVLVTHVFVVAYEEPMLRRTFAKDYEAYCENTRRWWPKR